MLTVLLIIVFLACLGFLIRDGLWTNTIRLISVVTAALLATNYFEWVAGIMQSINSTYEYFWDTIALWGLFALFYTVFRLATDQLSRFKVRFPIIVDKIGGPLMAVWVGWVMVCFTTMSLHVAPLARNPLNGGFTPEQKMFYSTAPDRLWLGFMQRMSLGPFSPMGGGQGFDPQGEFMLKYAQRRANLEENANKTGALRTRN
jgi:hypothetical protein